MRSSGARPSPLQLSGEDRLLGAAALAILTGLLSVLNLIAVLDALIWCRAKRRS